MIVKFRESVSVPTGTSGITIFILSFALHISLSSESLSYDYGNAAGNELDGIYEILRGKNSILTAEGSKWSDVIDTWISNVGEETLKNILGEETTEFGDSLTRESIWQIWNGLRTRTRELVVKKLYPFLISGRSPSGRKWRIHCADAHKLCMEDTNCYWKYLNFLSSCSDDDLTGISGLDLVTRDDEDNETENKLTRKRKQKTTAARRSVKRDVYAVEKRIKKERNSPRRLQQRKHHKKSVFWMGKHIPAQSRPKMSDLLKYFSLGTKSNRCSSKCVNSLIMLNETVYGTLLAHCDCRAKTMPGEYRDVDMMKFERLKPGENREKYFQTWEETCVQRQTTAQSCRPRRFPEMKGLKGCTATRLHCEKEPSCKEAQEEFLSRCSQVINGIRCTPACLESVEKLRNATSDYDTCICDGSEGPTCRDIRKHVIQLCDSSTNTNQLPRTKDNSSQNSFAADHRKNANHLFSGSTQRTQGSRNSANFMLSHSTLLLIFATFITRYIIKVMT